MVPGDVHRAEKIQTGLGGKGQDVAITLKCLSSEANVNLAQFVGKGASGDAVYELLEGLFEKEELSLTIRAESEMRTCTSIIASDETTELVEPSGVIVEKEMISLLRLVEEQAQRNAAGLCIMGSMPPGCDDSSYAKMFERAAGPDTLTVIDSVVGIGPLLKSMASSSKSGSAIFKVNGSELCRLAGVEKQSSEAGGTQIDEIVLAVKRFQELHSPYASQALDGFAITDGRHPAFFVSSGTTSDHVSVFQIPTPTLPAEQTAFPIGAGDAVAAGTLAAWLYLSDPKKNKPFIDTTCRKLLQKVHQHYEGLQSAVPAEQVAAFAFGLGCGSASKYPTRLKRRRVQPVFSHGLVNSRRFPNLTFASQCHLFAFTIEHVQSLSRLLE